MPDVSFQNTEIAFAHKSDNDLKKAALLFRSFNYPLLIRFGPAVANALIGILPPVRSLIRSTIYSHFCGGENIAECEKTIAQLHERKVGTILDYSVEGEENEAAFDQTCQEILATIEKAAANRNSIPFSVFKTTGIGRMDLLEKVSSGTVLSAAETTEFEKLKSRFNRICDKAAKEDVRLFIDAEDTFIQGVINDLTYQAMLRHNKEKAIIFNTIQCYRTGSVEHIRKQLNNMDCYLGFKLVRGAYMEKERERAAEKGIPSPIHQDKQATDREFDDAISLCVEHIGKVSFCAGTHNEESCTLLMKLLEQNNIAPFHPHVWFAQLLGMSDHISFNLAAAGYNVAKYVPYGPVKSVLPYLSRRAIENTSVKGQSGRELRLISQELKRRKQKS